MIPKLGVDMTTKEAEECVRSLSELFGLERMVQLVVEGVEQQANRRISDADYTKGTCKRLFDALEEDA